MPASTGGGLCWSAIPDQASPVMADIFGRVVKLVDRIILAIVTSQIVMSVKSREHKVLA